MLYADWRHRMASMKQTGTDGQAGRQADGQAGMHIIFLVWYPKFFQKNLSYETWDCYYQKMQKKQYKMGLCIIFVSALPQIVDSLFKLVFGLVYTILH